MEATSRALNTKDEAAAGKCKPLSHLEAMLNRGERGGEGTGAASPAIAEESAWGVRKIAWARMS